MLFNVGGYENPKGKMPEFEYTGSYQLIDDGKVGGVQNWRLKLLTSGKLTFKKGVKNVDLFIVGGGAGGATNFMDGSQLVAYGASGGGYTKTYLNVAVETNKEYPVVIGDGGAESSKYTNHRGGSTTVFGVSAAGGYPGGYTGNFADGSFNPKGGNGGSGGADYVMNPATGYEGGYNGSAGGGPDGGTGQGLTTAEFGETGGTVYSTGGSTGTVGNGTTSKDPNGKSNTGNGGTSTGGASRGGSGIVVIRNAR